MSALTRPVGQSPTRDAITVAIVVGAFVASVASGFEWFGSKLLEATILQVATGASVAVTVAQWRSSSTLKWAALAVVVVCGLATLFWANAYDVALAQIRSLPEMCQRLISL